MAKSVPLRMCTVCRASKEKKDLIRIVKNKEGEIFIDPTGKANGRGAYICPNAECFNKARKAKRLERAFETAIPDEIYQKLENDLKGGGENV